MSIRGIRRGLAVSGESSPLLSKCAKAVENLMDVLRPAGFKFNPPEHGMTAFLGLR